MSIPAIYAVIFAVFLLVAWVGGWHTASRQCRMTAEAYSKVLAQVERLDGQQQLLVRENIELNKKYYQLEAKYELALKEIARLSADLVANADKNFTR